MSLEREPSRRGTRPVRPPATTAQVADAKLRALVVQERAISFYAKASPAELVADGGRHARAARVLVDELLKWLGTEIHEGG